MVVDVTCVATLPRALRYERQLLGKKLSFVAEVVLWATLDPHGDVAWKAKKSYGYGRCLGVRGHDGCQKGFGAFWSVWRVSRLANGRLERQ